MGTVEIPKWEFAPDLIYLVCDKAEEQGPLPADSKRIVEDYNGMYRNAR
jgi:hypothetical protein